MQARELQGRLKRKMRRHTIVVLEILGRIPVTIFIILRLLPDVFPTQVRSQAIDLASIVPYKEYQIFGRKEA